MNKKEELSFFQRLLNWLKSLFFKKELELAILGIQNAGKTTLVEYLSTEKFKEDQIPTIGFNYKEMTKGKVLFKCWDMGGQPRFRDSWEKYCRTADAIVYVVDSADIASMDVAKLQLQYLLNWPSLYDIPLLVLGNKNDLVESLNVAQLINAMDLGSIKDRIVACYSISCKNGNQLDTVLKWLSNVKRRNR